MTYDLPFPPSVNSMFRNVQGRGRVKTQEYKDWLMEAGLMLRRQKPVAVVGQAELLIELDHTRRGDASNRIKAVEDLIVTHGILADDSKKYVKRVTVSWEPINGCRVTIKPAELCERTQIASAAAALGQE